VGTVFSTAQGKNTRADTNRGSRYAERIVESRKNWDGPVDGGEKNGVTVFLTAALNREDQISRGVYEDYMNRAIWPAGLDDETFAQIKLRLTTLVEDTKSHAKILQALIRFQGWFVDTDTLRLSM